MLKKKNEPEIVKLSSKNIDEIQLRLTENSLNEEGFCRKKFSECL